MLFTSITAKVQMSLYSLPVNFVACLQSCCLERNTQAPEVALASIYDVEATSISCPRATFELRYQRMREDYAAIILTFFPSLISLLYILSIIDASLPTHDPVGWNYAA